MSLAFGELRLAPSEFWHMTLAEWRAALDGYARSAEHAMRRIAWQVSFQLMAAGCRAENVTVAKLLGEKERKLSVKQRIARDPEVQKAKRIDRMVTRLRREREKE